MAECICVPVPFEDCITYGSAVEPGSAFEPNPNCPEHFRKPPHRLADGTWSDGVDRTERIDLRQVTDRYEVTVRPGYFHVWHSSGQPAEFYSFAEAVAYADRTARTTKNGDA